MGEGKRATRMDRDTYISLLNLAYEKEALSEIEREDRVDQAANAVHLYALDALVADLPSRLELEGKMRVPGKVQRMMVGIGKVVRHPALYYATLALGIFVTVPLSILLGNTYLPHVIKYPSVAASILGGLMIVIASCFNLDKLS